MQHVSELTTQHQQELSEPSQKKTDSAAPSTAQPSALSEAHIDRLWLRMTRIYAHKWTSSHGETDDGTWRKGLADMTPDNVAHGIGECLKRRDPWPPTLPEFRAMCRPNTPAYHRRFAKLPPPLCTREVAECELSRIRKVLKPWADDEEATKEREAIQTENIA